MVDVPTQKIGASGPDPEPRQRIGPFRILERLGAGGMGVVHLAEREEPKQRVALKVIRSDRLDRTYRARFAMEQQALARMDHPNIARLIDAGDEGELAWFAMEYVPGQPLTDYCREHKLTLEQRLMVFAQICDGVQHAHMKGLLHRDLKPGNILVREIDGRPVAKIIDFGLAQPVDPALIRATLHEGLRQIVGTFAYMSPEQAGRTEGDLDTRTDVYSLGVVLYELLTGELPIDLEAMRRSEIDLLGAFLRVHEPSKPSTRLSELGDRLSTTAAERRVTPQRLRTLVRGELDWVTMKALARDRQMRYPTVRELGQDVERYLQHRPVEAGPPSTWYVLKKWVQRHAGAVAAAGVFTVGAAGFAVYASWLARRAEAAESRRELVAQAAVVAEHVRLAIEDLWPADEAHVPLMDEWLQQVPRLLAAKDALQSLTAELQVEVAAAKDAGARSVLSSQLAGVARGLQKLDELHSMAAVVKARAIRAGALRQRTIDAYAALWAQAQAEVRKDARFGDFELPLVPGLVPLGMNPQSDLQEFYLLYSAGEPELPARRADGGFQVGPMTGLVFVLVPGGPRSVPAPRQSDPPRVVHVRPFLIARYETTQAQFARLCSDRATSAGELAWFNPANEMDGLQRTPKGAGEPPMGHTNVTWDGVTWVHPVQQVSSIDVCRVMGRWSLMLPTLAQWLHAAVAGDEPTFPWARPELHGFANLLDPIPGEEGTAGARDGFQYTSPVGSLAANPRGIHDMLGNVAEWCREGYRDDAWQPDSTDSRRGVILGGSFKTPPTMRGFGIAQMLTQNSHEAVGVRFVIELPQ